MATRDVTSYGAVGDGTTDDTTAVQAAASACGSGDTLYFPGASTYLIDYFVIPASNVIVTGDSTTTRAIVKKRTASGTNTPLISCIDKNNITIRNLRLDGQGPLQSWWDGNPYTADFVVLANNIQIKGGSGHVVSYVYSHDAGSAGIRFYGCTGATVTNLVGDNNGFGTIAVYAYTYNGTPKSSNITFDGGSAGFDYCDGVRFVQSDDCTISNFESSNCRNVPAAPVQFAGFYAETASRIIVDTCRGVNNSRMAFDANEGVGGTYDFIIRNCVWGPGANNGVLPGLSNFLVQHCVFLGDEARFEARCTDHKVKNCTFIGQTVSPGVRLQDNNTTNLTLVNNDFRSVSGSHIDPPLLSTPGYSAVGTNTSDPFPGIYPLNGSAIFGFV